MTTGMKITIDEANGTVVVIDGNGEKHMAMDTPEAFSAVSRAWLRCGWDTKYVYSFSWMGRPMIQLPEDMIRLQEVIYRVRPDVIVETGVAHGGSLIFHASLCRAIGKGRVIGVDIEIRPHNRAAIESHEMFDYITLIEGSSIAPNVVEQVKNLVAPNETVLVILDSNHTRDHVTGELEAYGALVTPGSYIVACDGIMADVKGAPRSGVDWDWNNPTTAARDFAAGHPEFAIEEPEFPFNEGVVKDRVTYWPSAYLKRIAN
jgi:cephalosporin hydroxylase